MTLRITVDIFSGRPNPIVELDGKKARDFLERAKPAKALKRGAMPSPEYRLGYRGLIVEQIRAPGVLADAARENIFRQVACD